MRNKSTSRPVRRSRLLRRRSFEAWIGVVGSAPARHSRGKGGFFHPRTLVTLLICGAAVYSIVFPTMSGFGFLRPEASSEISPTTLTFAERVAYQTAIEDVYWRHRIWPKTNPGPKPSLDTVMSQADIEKKVTEYLRKSLALEEYWQQPISADQLQAEMERMASDTKQPKVLRELFEALGNDPFVIAECLARPVLTERLVREQSNVAIGRDGSPSRPLALARPRRGEQAVVAPYQANAAYTLPDIASPSGGCTDDTWLATTVTNAPSPRYAHMAVWTGSEMIVWGGDAGPLNTGGKYNPSTDSWIATSTTNAPSARDFHTAVWTGSEMIVWGGSPTTNTGGRYNPATDSWTSTSTTNAPAARSDHTALWTDSEMIVWGGNTNSGATNTGGRYNPATDSWTATCTTNAPAARFYHTAVLAGSEMIIWGGWDGSNYFNTGGRYNAGSKCWTATSTTNAPAARIWHTAAWANTTSEMIVWGGDNGGLLNTGGKYNPDTDSWTATSMTAVPEQRAQLASVWTGSEMIVWGGRGNTMPANGGGRYDPGTDSWRATSSINAPPGRRYLTAVWTGSEMIAWGGQAFGVSLNTGGRYCAAAASPTPTPTPMPTCTPSGLLIVAGQTSEFYDYAELNDIVQYSFAQSQVRPNQFAIFQTHNPWGNILLRNHITADGYTYSIFGPPALVGFPFADYRVVVLDWSDTESIDFDPPYTSVIPALETYISNGGVVWIQGAIQNGVFPLPFAGTATYNPQNDNFIVDTSSPMVQGMPNPFEGDAASHAIFAGYPGNAHVVVVGGINSGGPTTLYELRPSGPCGTPTATATPTATVTATATSTPTASATATAILTPTATVTPTTTATATPTASATATGTPSSTPRPTPTPRARPTPAPRP